ncbi:MAG: NAD-dependent epimerase/dehydratase family protein [Pirellulales bacterium]
MSTSQASETANFGAIHLQRPLRRASARRLKCAVLGATGFVGRHLVAALSARGDQVRCIARPTSDISALAGLDVEVQRADFADLPALKRALAGVECVFHTAGVTKAFRPQEFDQGNVQTTRHLLAACVDRQTPPQVVLVSSLAAVGPSPVDQPRTESDQPVPVSDYGRSKCAAETAARQFAGWGPISIARPPMVFGPGERDVFAIALSIARTGLHFVPGWRARRYSLVHVADLAEGLLRVAEAGERLPSPGATPDDWSKGVYFLADDEMPTYAELGRMMGRALGRRTRVVMMPPRSIYVAAGFNAVWSRLIGRPAALNFDKAREGLAGSWTCRAAKAHRELGWAPEAKLEQRLSETMNWCREAGWI